MKRLLAVAALAISAISLDAQSPAPAPAPAASIAGTWTVSSNIGGSQNEMLCVWIQKGAEFSGKCAGQQGELEVTGKVEGKTVAWQFTVNYEGQPLTVGYSGTLETPEKITGAADVQPMNIGGEFTATKARN